MSAIRKLLYCVDNEWRQSATDKYTPVMNPSTGEQIAAAPVCLPAEVDAAVQAAKAAYPDWSSKPVGVRTQVLFRFRELVNQHFEELSVLLATEMGKNLNESRGDVHKVVEACEVAVGAPMEIQGYAMMEATRSHDICLYREAVGVFLGIAPYNFPAMIPFGWFIPLCIVAGNTMVLKAASMVPQTGMRLLELLIEAGLPKGVVNLVTCSRQEVANLLSHPDIRGVSFVGSTSTGVKIYSGAAAAGKRVQCLTEAKNHALLLEDAPLEWSAQRVINSCFGCAGQRCMALPVVVAQESVADRFVEILKGLGERLVVGAAYDPDTQLGPVISAAHKKSVLDWIDKGVAEGADLVLDGRACAPKGFENGYFVGPTIFDHVAPGMTIGDQEVFGPVVCIKRVRDFEEGLAVMNANPFANGSSIFTQNGHYAREFARRTDGGMVGVNVGIPVPLAFFPFCGNKRSFFGDLHVLGRDGLRFYTRAKTVTTKWVSPKESGDARARVSTWEGTINREL
ncbi:CoA-acylating methylmalonate-semialdehyde dehydrogenase [Solidesulfovibrio alcoholivorans]|uniref:CoA-acylating methylmalonate-semialdehyde dehydrogenase n=1 Tax=Solidesulfovibrio alcoholivorans TaxID=81406 RepID=UPI000495EE51|nr:CoA-acylating methylmalonate-semialdehyde dehydrogenase [Solidesulfovibrio alcoholivorans]